MIISDLLIGKRWGMFAQPLEGTEAQVIELGNALISSIAYTGDVGRQARQQSRLAQEGDVGTTAFNTVTYLDQPAGVFVDGYLGFEGMRTFLATVPSWT